MFMHASRLVASLLHMQYSNANLYILDRNTCRDNMMWCDQLLNVVHSFQSPRPERKETYEPVDYIKQFEEEEEKLREDERRAKEDLERKLREEQKAQEVGSLISH